MLMAFWSIAAPILGSVASSVVSSKLGGKEARQTNAQSAEFQDYWNRRSEDLSREQFNRSQAFAKWQFNQLRKYDKRRIYDTVRDAQRSGIHPLVALGASGPGFGGVSSPGPGGFSPGGVAFDTPSGGSAIGEGLERAGAMVGEYLEGREREKRANTEQKRQRARQESSDKMDREMHGAQLRRLKAAENADNALATKYLSDAKRAEQSVLTKRPLPDPKSLQTDRKSPPIRTPLGGRVKPSGTPAERVEETYGEWVGDGMGFLQWLEDTIISWGRGNKTRGRAKREIKR
jgi:hypothetical protein